MMDYRAADDKPPCNDCSYGPAQAPPLLEVNIDAWDLWKAVKDQRRFNGAIDITAIHLEAARLEVDLSPSVISKIKALEAETVKQDATD